MTLWVSLRNTVRNSLLISKLTETLSDEELDGVPVVAARAPFLGRGVAAGDERPEAEYLAVRSPHERLKRTILLCAGNEFSGLDEVLVLRQFWSIC